MWHLYYNDTDIHSLSKKKQNLDLPYLRISDELGEKFTNLEYRYIDWQVIKQAGRNQLVKRKNITEPVWHSNFYQVPAGTQADHLITRSSNVVTSNSPKTFWITEWNNPLRYLGKITQSELLVPADCKISIFTQKTKETLAYHDQDFPC